jgi:hypothetical protein
MRVIKFLVIFSALFSKFASSDPKPPLYFWGEAIQQNLTQTSVEYEFKKGVLCEVADSPKHMIQSIPLREVVDNSKEFSTLILIGKWVGKKYKYHIFQPNKIDFTKDNKFLIYFKNGDYDSISEYKGSSEIFIINYNRKLIGSSNYFLNIKNLRLTTDQKDVWSIKFKSDAISQLKLKNNELKQTPLTKERLLHIWDQYLKPESPNAFLTFVDKKNQYHNLSFELYALRIEDEGFIFQGKILSSSNINLENVSLDQANLFIDDCLLCGGDGNDF